MSNVTGEAARCDFEHLCNLHQADEPARGFTCKSVRCNRVVVVFLSDYVASLPTPLTQATLSLCLSSSATMSLHLLHYAHKRLRHVAHLRQRLCRFTFYTADTSDSVALLTQLPARSCPATCSLCLQRFYCLPHLHCCPKELLTAQECAHTFHDMCLQEWATASVWGYIGSLRHV